MRKVSLQEARITIINYTDNYCRHLRSRNFFYAINHYDRIRQWNNIKLLTFVLPVFCIFNFIFLESHGSMLHSQFREFRGYIKIKMFILFETMPLFELYRNSSNSDKNKTWVLVNLWQRCHHKNLEWLQHLPIDSWVKYIIVHT